MISSVYFWTFELLQLFNFHFFQFFANSIWSLEKFGWHLFSFAVEVERHKRFSASVHPSLTSNLFFEESYQNKEPSNFFFINVICKTEKDSDTKYHYIPYQTEVGSDPPQLWRGMFSQWDSSGLLKSRRPKSPSGEDTGFVRRGALWILGKNNFFLLQNCTCFFKTIFVPQTLASYPFSGC